MIQQVAVGREPKAMIDEVIEVVLADVSREQGISGSAHQSAGFAHAQLGLQFHQIWPEGGGGDGRVLPGNMRQGIAGEQEKQENSNDRLS